MVFPSARFANTEATLKYNYAAVKWRGRKRIRRRAADENHRLVD